MKGGMAVVLTRAVTGAGRGRGAGPPVAGGDGRGRLPRGPRPRPRPRLSPLTPGRRPARLYLRGCPRESLSSVLASPPSSVAVHGTTKCCRDQRASVKWCVRIGIYRHGIYTAAVIRQTLPVTDCDGLADLGQPGHCLPECCIFLLRGQAAAGPATWADHLVRLSGRYWHGMRAESYAARCGVRVLRRRLCGMCLCLSSLALCICLCLALSPSASMSPSASFLPSPSLPLPPSVTP